MNLRSADCPSLLLFFTIWCFWLNFKECRALIWLVLFWLYLILRPHVIHTSPLTSRCLFLFLLPDSIVRLSPLRLQPRKFWMRAMWRKRGWDSLVTDGRMWRGNVTGSVCHAQAQASLIRSQSRIKIKNCFLLHIYNTKKCFHLHPWKESIFDYCDSFMCCAARKKCVHLFIVK